MIRSSSEFQPLLSKNAIRHETSAPYSPHQNGTAERSLLNVALFFQSLKRCVLIESNLPKELWTQQACRTDFILHVDGKKPDLSRMKVFGSVC